MHERNEGDKWRTRQGSKRIDAQHMPMVMVDETEEGNLFAALRTREADLEKHINSGQGEEKKDANREKAWEEARKRLEEEAKKPPAERRMPSTAATRISRSCRR